MVKLGAKLGSETVRETFPLLAETWGTGRHVSPQVRTMIRPTTQGSPHSRSSLLAPQSALLNLVRDTGESREPLSGFNRGLDTFRCYPRRVSLDVAWLDASGVFKACGRI